MRKLLLAVIVTALSFSTAAVAQRHSSVRYRWHDGHGQMHFSDSLSMEAMKYGYDVVDDRGLVVQKVARQLTPQERAAANKVAEVEAAKKSTLRQAAADDTQMLAAYPDEDSYVIYQQQTLGTIDQRIRTIRINLQSQAKALTDLLDRAADMEQSKKTVPKFLVTSIADQRNVVTEIRATLQRQLADRAQTVSGQASALAHYRQVKSASASATSSP